MSAQEKPMLFNASSISKNNSKGRNDWDILVLIGHPTETGEKPEWEVWSKGGSSKRNTD
jgi:hypothetical protein